MLSHAGMTGSFQESALAVTMASALAVAAPYLRRQARRFWFAGSGRKLTALRQYVPAALTERVAHGHGVDCGEQEVTVMFVDLHGYTAFSDNLEPEAVFSFISRFTQAVSQVICDQGGFVSEFSGDGMMAVFGAPLEHTHKERAALRAYLQARI